MMLTLPTRLFIFLQSTQSAEPTSLPTTILATTVYTITAGNAPICRCVHSLCLVLIT